MSGRHMPLGCSANMWAAGMLKDLRRAWGFVKKTPRLRIAWCSHPPLDKTRSWRHA